MINEHTIEALRGQLSDGNYNNKDIERYLKNQIEQLELLLKTVEPNERIIKFFYREVYSQLYFLEDKPENVENRAMVLYDIKSARKRRLRELRKKRKEREENNND